jgi:hypothetical protein
MLLRRGAAGHSGRALRLCGLFYRAAARTSSERLAELQRRRLWAPNFAEQPRGPPLPGRAAQTTPSRWRNSASAGTINNLKQHLRSAQSNFSFFFLPFLTLSVRKIKEAERR